MSTGPILVVEDDADIREMIEIVLAMRGYEVECARDGADALDKLRHGPRPSLVLLDLMLPHVDGVEVIRSMRASAELAPVPIVIVSGDSAAPDEARKSGADGCLLKPVELEELVRTVRGFVPAETVP